MLYINKSRETCVDLWYSTLGLYQPVKTEKASFKKSRIMYSAKKNVNLRKVLDVETVDSDMQKD